MANRYSQPPRGSGRGWQDRGSGGDYNELDEGRVNMGGLQPMREPMAGNYRDYDAPNRESEYGRAGYGQERYRGGDYAEGSQGQYGQGGYDDPNAGSGMGQGWSGGERQNWAGRGGGGGGQMSQRGGYQGGSMGGGSRSHQQGGGFGGYGGEGYGGQGYGNQGFGGGQGGYGGQGQGGFGGSQGYGSRGYGGGSYGSGGIDTGGFRESDYGTRGYQGGGYGSGGQTGRGTGARRGPKGWTRSDERLKEDICERLYNTQHIDSSEVTVDVSEGKVTLDGTVADRNMKHAIEDLVDACPGVKDIDNRVRVTRDESGQSSQWGQSGTGVSSSASSQPSGLSGGQRTRKE